MTKKLWFLPFLALGMIFFIQCSDEPFYSAADDPAEMSALKAGKGGGNGGGGGGGGGGGHTEVIGNNLSFPAIAVDGFGITDLAEETFNVPYTGDNPGLTQAEIDDLELNGPWFPQKTEGNVWQADFTSSAAVDISFIDWGDVIESVNPKLRRPFRLEVTLYAQSTMWGYTMALLEYPSSMDEVQGTNTIPYLPGYATVVSAQPRLVIQFLGNIDHEALVWDEIDRLWMVPGDPPNIPEVTPLSFSTELNVGGKYIYGASKGGWKPVDAGFYRITFYIPSSSGINLRNAEIDNYGADEEAGEESETGAAIPEVDPDNNLTYVDVLVVAGGGGGKR